MFEKYLKSEKDIVFVGLNPTQEAIKNNAVFCKDSSFWNVLKKAHLIRSYPTLKKCANEIFDKENAEYCDQFRLGFVDLVKNDTSKKSKNVKPSDNDVKILFKSLYQVCPDSKPLKVAIMGLKVLDAIVAYFNNEKDCSWQKAHNEFLETSRSYSEGNDNNITCSKDDEEKTYNSSVNYGYFIKYVYNNREFAFYILPFPNNVPVKCRYLLYKDLLEDSTKNFSPTIVPRNNFEIVYNTRVNVRKASISKQTIRVFDHKACSDLKRSRESEIRTGERFRQTNHTVSVCSNDSLNVVQVYSLKRGKKIVYTPSTNLTQEQIDSAQ